jgi:hypothetical protein
MKYCKKPGEVEANQFFYGRPMIPGVVYPVDRTLEQTTKRPYIFTGEDSKQYLAPGDWVVMEEDDEDNMTFYVIKPEAFDLLFDKAEEVQHDA